MHSSLALAVLAGAAFASACGDEKHFQRVRRAAASSAAASRTVAAGTSAAAAATAPSRTDEASNAQITNAAEECTPYSYPPVAALQAAGVFPEIWEIANLSTAQPDVTALFQSLNGSIPNIAPKGTPAGDFSGVNYDGATDPDCWWTYEQCHTPKAKGLQSDVYNLATPETWGLTYDDGPNCSHNAFYDYLQDQKQKATMFYIGSNVLDWPLEAQRGLTDGHEICAHTWSHRYMTALTNEQVFAELYYSKKAIKDVLGVTVQCWRPPYGDVDDRVRYIAQSLGMQTIIWSDNTFDYNIATLSRATIEGNYNEILNGGKNGSYAVNGTIVLTHELNADTISLAEEFLPKIKEAFKYVAPVGVAMNNTEPYVESGYTYPNFAQWTAGTTSISLAAPTAVSTDASLSIPLSTGQTGSVSATVAYASAAATSSSGSGSGGSSGGSNGARGTAQGIVGAITAAVVGAIGAGAITVML
ncbi:chitin deacetylase [Rhodotorula paludigena]|uniref:chitin deacetylase n=1 Tax=Rhodotorula paludigena TaxID=86838 RepID=UPI003180908E